MSLGVRLAEARVLPRLLRLVRPLLGEVVAAVILAVVGVVIALASLCAAVATGRGHTTS